MDRRLIEVQGIVQGIGFRPFVHDLAIRLGLHGSVKNRTGDVLIDLEGESQSLDRFVSELLNRPPPSALIERLSWVVGLPRGDPNFRIEPSDLDRNGPIFIAPDLATCDACLRELFDPGDRRFRYPFLNCTHCGPRLTIITAAPYDRARTTMAGFALCEACRAEYEDPSNRRYHAQPIACPDCGPRLRVIDARGQTFSTVDALDATVSALKGGAIVALKSLGGFHLACLAGDNRTVAELRRRKHRDDKPLAIMVGDLDALASLVETNEIERTLLQSPRRPIVLLRRKSGARLAEPLAPRNPLVGVMLPYTPLHHLLMNELRGLPLVMTSGNRSDEPIAYEDDDARARLADIADLFLTHDRPIHLRCDDSVTRVVGGVELPLRRSRGEAPRPLSLPRPCQRPILALGGQLKAAFALGRDRHAFLSHHLGDLDHYGAYCAFVDAIAHYERLFAIRPETLVHDLHPDYASTRYGIERSASEGIERIGVQHHHAHIASCMAENGLEEPVIGVAFDGTGYGTDGTVWGGEFLLGDDRSFQRAAYLRPVGMPGGERAIHEPWRMALAHLIDAGLSTERIEDRILHADVKIIRTLMERQLNTPLTSSAGRLFDAVASMLGLRDRVGYEGQAAAELEALATEVPPEGSYPFAVVEGANNPPAKATLVVDTRPLIAAVACEVARGVEVSRIARRFQSSMVEIIVTVCVKLRERSGLNIVALSGGVFLNALLSSETPERLEAEGFRVCRHRRVPPGDGGLSLGQLAIASALTTTD